MVERCPQLLCTNSFFIFRFLVSFTFRQEKRRPEGETRGGEGCLRGYRTLHDQTMPFVAFCCCYCRCSFGSILNAVIWHQYKYNFFCSAYNTFNHYMNTTYFFRLRFVVVGCGCSMYGIHNISDANINIVLLHFIQGGGGNTLKKH